MDTTWESNKYTIKHHKQESQEVSPFPAGDHKATMNSQETNQKSEQEQAVCEEKGLTPWLGVIQYAESKNQCWQAERWRLNDLICIFSKWPPKTWNLT